MQKTRKWKYAEGMKENIYSYVVNCILSVKI